MQLAIKRLKTEFYIILVQNKDRLDPESVSGNSFTDRQSSLSDCDDKLCLTVDSISMAAMADLKGIAECMISTSYSKECVKIYVIVRKLIVDEALYYLGVERLDFSQVQKMEWEVLEWKIKCWLNAVKVAVSTLFHGEKTLCNYVFGSPERNIAESCFAEICRDNATLLFGFLENVAKCKKTPEKMFRTLDLYESNLRQLATNRVHR